MVRVLDTWKEDEKVQSKVTRKIILERHEYTPREKTQEGVRKRVRKRKRGRKSC